MHDNANERPGGRSFCDLYLGERDSEERGGLRGEGEVGGHAVLSLYFSALTPDF